MDTPISVTGGWVERLVGNTATFSTVPGATYMMVASTTWIYAQGSGDLSVGWKVISGSNESLFGGYATNNMRVAHTVNTFFTAGSTTTTVQNALYYGNNGSYSRSGTRMLLFRVG